MRNFTQKISFAFLSVALFAIAVYADFPKPSPGGAASLGDYSSSMPNPRVSTDFAKPSIPYPTNKWFTSLFVPPVVDNNSFAYHYGNRVSAAPMMIVYDHTFPDTWSPPINAGSGYMVGGHDIKKNTNNDMIASVVMAFAVQGALGTDLSNVIAADNILLKDYSDWSFTAVLQDRTDPTKKITSTFGKGFVFTYNYFSIGVNPRLRMKYTADGSQTAYYYNLGGTMTPIPNNTTVSTDSIMIKVYAVRAGNYNTPKYQYFGIYAPSGSSFSIKSNSNYCDITLTGETESERYLSIALLKSPQTSEADSEAFNIFNDYYRYAYNFITDTKVTWNFNQSQSMLTTDFNFTFDANPKRSGGNFLQNQTVFALYPHQWKNAQTAPNKSYTYNSIRGNLKVHAGSSFSTEHKFNGIVPFLTYEVPDNLKQRLQQYVSYDRDYNPMTSRGANTYYYGKGLAKSANLITVFNQHGNLVARDNMIERLKRELSLWYSGGNGTKGFKYDKKWGGIIGTPYAFESQLYNDHHFHYGYFIYASAILAMYDPSFAESTQYKGMVDLLVREINNPSRTDVNFPFLRGFDVYEGHSYANGLGGGSRDFGNDEESSSEAMNAWAGIYLWGMVTNNTDWIKLAIYGYTTQYESAKNYYFNMDGDIWNINDYDHASVGVLYDGSFNWGLFWSPVITQSVMGIQVMPLTPSMLYLGYNTDYARNFYNEMWARRGTTSNQENFWRDIWLRFKALFDAPGALDDWHAANLPAKFNNHSANNPFLGDDGSSLSYSYHFINFFNALGTVDTGYYADYPSFLVMNKDGARTFLAYNPDQSNSKTVRFYRRSGGTGPVVPNGGSMTIPPGTLAKTGNFTEFEYYDTDTSDSPPAEPVRDIDTYSIYSDHFEGCVWDDSTSPDGVGWSPWSQTIAIDVRSSTVSAGSFEGYNYMIVGRVNTGWGAWSWYYLNGVKKDMRAFYGGTLEASFKIDNPSPVANNFEIGLEGKGGAQVWKRIGDFGFNQTIAGKWHTVSIPLTSANGFSEDMLSEVPSPFIMRHNAGSSAYEWGINVYVDCIVWKKPHASTPFYTDIRKRTDDTLTTSSASFVWDNLSAYKQPNAVSMQYIEISLNSFQGYDWGIQIYSDNKGLTAGVDPIYTGQIDSTTISGLVNMRYSNIPMLPMKWRVAPSTIGDYEVFADNWFDPWYDLRDISAFNSSPQLHNGCDEVKVMDRRGFKYQFDYVNTNDYIFSAFDGNKKVRIYFMADFTNAKKGVLYSSNIILEYFSE